MNGNTIGHGLVVTALGMTLAACSTPTVPQATTFYAPMLGANEVPAVPTTSTGGLATLTLSGSAGSYSIGYTITVNALNSPIQSHVHVGSATVAGPVRLWLCGGGGQPDCAGGGNTVVTGTLITGTNAATTPQITMDSLVSAMRAGNAYVNVHTVANPGGEIRGQLSGVTLAQ